MCTLFAPNTQAQCWQRMVGGVHSLAVRTNGTLWAWGRNTEGQLGDGSNTDKDSSIQIGIDTNWQGVACGSFHSFAIKSDSTLWAWGRNTEGQLGDGTNISKNSPVQIGSDTNWHTLAAGIFHTLAIKTDGTLWAWGLNLEGQLGDGTNIDKNSPIQIGLANNWQSVTAGRSSSLAVKTDGTLWVWGDNNAGQLGNGTKSDTEESPVQIGSATDWQSVAGGLGFSMAIKKDGTLWSCGTNVSGQLGDGTNVLKTSFVQIGSDTNWQNVVGGNFHALALKTDETLWAWGQNAAGQLGDGTNVDRYTPQQIACPSAGTNNQLQQGMVKIFPNPVSNFINIKIMDGNFENLTYEVLNILGQKVEMNSLRPDSLRIDLPPMPQGMYFLTIRRGNELITKAFVKI